jgi:hypothetical protein
MNMSRWLRRIRVEVAGAGRMIVNAPPLLAMTWFNAWYQARLQLLQRIAETLEFRSRFRIRSFDRSHRLGKGSQETMMVTAVYWRKGREGSGAAPTTWDDADQGASPWLWA